MLGWLSPGHGWANHIDHLSCKLRKRYGAIRNIALCRVVPESFVLSLYKIYVESVVAYAAPAWFPSAPVSQLSRLERKQILALRSALNLPWEIDDADVLAAGIISCSNLVPIVDFLSSCTARYLEGKWSICQSFRATVIHHHDQTSRVASPALLKFSPLQHFTPPNDSRPVVPSISLPLVHCM